MSKVFDNMMRNMKVQTYEELKKEGEDLYEVKLARENSLLEAYKEKILKSKELIKEARKIKAQRAKAKASRKDKKEKNAVSG